jgi:hypothetical protein
VRAPFDAIDHVLAFDPGGRGIAAIFTAGAAVRAARALRGARRVLIATGFSVSGGYPETDGPPGAAAVGRALRTLGARVSYVTDPQNVPVLEAVLKTLDEPVDVEVYGERGDVAASMLARLRPTHLVAVERPGRTARGQYLSMRGHDVTPWNRPIDELFVLAMRVRRATERPGGGRPRPSSATGHHPAALPRPHRYESAVRPVTIGVGDGGNEIGMGNVRARLVRERSPLARIASVVHVHHLVVGGTSNWGAYGLVAALAREVGRDLLHAPSLEARLIEACVRAGAIDGITRQAEPTVDGLDVSAHAAVVELLRLAARARRT